MEQASHTSTNNIVIMTRECNTDRIRLTMSISSTYQRIPTLRLGDFARTLEGGNGQGHRRSTAPYVFLDAAPMEPIFANNTVEHLLRSWRIVVIFFIAEAKSPLEVVVILVLAVLGRFVGIQGAFVP